MAVATRVRKWTLAEVHRLPEDGNKYELVRGDSNRGGRVAESTLPFHRRTE